jgi:DNA repair exonuclease SbcCD ATPase subunit
MTGICVGAFVSLAVLAAAPNSSLAGDQPVGADKVAKEAQEALEAAKEYTAQQKEAFQRKAHEELVAIQKQIIALQGKVGEASAATRAELQKSLAELERKKDAAKDRLDELRAATDAKWTELKSGVNAAIDELKESYRKALSRLP